jgi:glyoxylate reductase
MHIVRAATDFEVWPDDCPPDRATLLSKVRDADGLLCLLTDKIDAELLDTGSKLKVVSQMAVGYDNIDVPACTSRGIPVGNTPGVLTETTADLAFALLLATARRVVEADHVTRNGDWKTWSPMQLTGPDVHHATIGIVGMGRIGYEVARRAAGFQMRILYSKRTPHVEAERDFGAEHVSLDELLAQSDFVSLHTPLSPETKHQISTPQLAKMKPTAMLINTARGPIVDQKALYEALVAGTIAAAGIDVFEVEPVPLSEPLLTLPNVVALPHIGSASIATRTKMAVLAAENLVAGLRGEPLPHQVN